MNDFDDLMRDAARDLRTETSDLHTPEFSPRTSAVPFASGIAVALLAVVGFFGARSLLDGVDANNQTTIEDIAGETTSSTTPPADPTGDRIITERPEQPTFLPDLGNTSLDPIATSDTDRPPLQSTGERLTDPDFGTELVQVTDAAPGVAVAPAHSQAATFNPSGSLFILYQQGYGHLLYDGATLEQIGEVEISANDVYDWSWHPTEPDILYFARDGANELVRLNVRTGASTEEELGFCDTLRQGLYGLGSTANGTQFMGLLCESDEGRSWLVYDLLNNDVLTQRATDADSAPVAASFDGSMFVVFEPDQIRVLDGELAPIREPLELTSDAGVVTLNDAGEAVVVVTVNDQVDGENGLAVGFNLVTGARRPLVQTRDSIFEWRSGMLSSSLGTGAVAVRSKPSGDASVPLVGEIAIVVLDQARTVIRLTRGQMSDSVDHGMEWGSAPFIALDPLGRYVLFSSDWNSNLATDTFAILLQE